MRFRRPNNQSGKLTLGSVDVTGKDIESEPVIGGHLTLAAARRLASEFQRHRALGRDPIIEQRQKRRRRALSSTIPLESFGDAARRFVEIYAQQKTRRWRETAALLGLRWDGAGFVVIPKSISALWADRSIKSITSDDIHEIVELSRKEGILGLKRRNQAPSEARARAMFSVLSKLFNWLRAERLIQHSPCEGLHRPAAPPTRDRVLADQELIYFWNACDKLAKPFGVVFKLLLLTGARRDEVARMTNGELSPDHQTWTLEKARTKNKREHELPLSPLARSLIRSLPPMNVGANSFIFTTNGRTPISGFSKMKNKIDAEILSLVQRDSRERPPSSNNLKPWRLHDLRRTCASGMAQLGVSIEVIEKVLNHVSGTFSGVTGVYQRYGFSEEKRAALELWSDHVTRLVESKGKGAS